MNKSIGESREENDKNSRKRENSLVLSIDQNGKIIRFNSECERITGYNKNEVLNNQFSNYLASEYHSKRWDVIFDSMRMDESTHDFKFPMITRYGNEVVVSWSTLPVENTGDLVKEIGLIGETITPEDEIIRFSGRNEKTKRKYKRDIQKNDKNGNRILFEIGNRKLVFGKNKQPTSKNIRKIKEENRSKKEIQKEKNIKKGSNRKKVEFEKKKINENYDKLGEDYKEIKNSLKELEKVNRELEKENKKLKIELESEKTRYKDRKQIKDDVTKDNNKIKLKILLKEFFVSLHESLNRNKRKEEFRKMMDDLNERKNLLDTLEVKIIEDKKNINYERNELCRLREKLELIEEEVEKRREFLVEQERKFNDDILNPSEKRGANNNVELEGTIYDENDNIEVEEVDCHDVLNKSDGAAAIIQRGILKQVNDSLADMLGYDIEEISDRSLFDFVDQEGFEGIEKYYRERLKGADSSSYESIFLTKDNNKICVNVNIKSSYLNGEKVDIMVVNKLNNKIDKENKKEEK